VEWGGVFTAEACEKGLLRLASDSKTTFLRGVRTRSHPAHHGFHARVGSPIRWLWARWEMANLST